MTSVVFPFHFYIIVSNEVNIFLMLAWVCHPSVSLYSFLSSCMRLRETLIQSLSRNETRLLHGVWLYPPQSSWDRIRPCVSGNFLRERSNNRDYRVYKHTILRLFFTGWRTVVWPCFTEPVSRPALMHFSVETFRKMLKQKKTWLCWFILSEQHRSGYIWKSGGMLLRTMQLIYNYNMFTIS